MLLLLPPCDLQDGTVRVWDCATYSCLTIIHPNPNPSKDSPGPVIPLDQPSQLLKCARSPGNTCVRFDTGGNWLLIGTADGYLMLWSCRLNTAVAHTQCVKGAVSSSNAGGGSGAGAGGGSSNAGNAVVPQVSFTDPCALAQSKQGPQLQLGTLSSVQRAAVCTCFACFRGHKTRTSP